MSSILEVLKELERLGAPAKKATSVGRATHASDRSRRLCSAEVSSDAVVDSASICGRRGPATNSRWRRRHPRLRHAPRPGRRPRRHVDPTGFSVRSRCARGAATERAAVAGRRTDADRRTAAPAATERRRAGGHDAIAPEPSAPVVTPPLRRFPPDQPDPPPPSKLQPPATEARPAQLAASRQMEALLPRRTAAHGHAAGERQPGDPPPGRSAGRRRGAADHGRQRVSPARRRR